MGNAKVVVAGTAASLMLSAAVAQAAPFAQGDLVVFRVGTGAATLSSAATAAFLDEFNPGSAATPVQSIALPITASGANNPLVSSGTASSAGLLSLSPNGKFLAFTGYNAAVGTAGVNGSTAPRVVGVADGSGNVNTTTSLTNYAVGDNPRAAVTTNGTDLFLSGTNNGATNNSTGGVLYATVGSTGAAATQVSTTTTNSRALSVFNGQLYVSSSSSGIRIGAVGSGVSSSTGQTITNLPGLNSSSPSSPYEFMFLSLNGLGSPDTLYTTDGNLVSKFYLDGGTGNWTPAGSITGTSTNGLNGSTGLAVALTAPGVVTIYGTSPTTLYSITDASGFGGTLAGVPTTLATAPTNEAFRGLAFAPTGSVVPEPTALGLIGVGSLLLGRRRRV